MTRLQLVLAAFAIGGAGAFAACSKTTPEPEKSSESPVATASAPPPATATGSGATPTSATAKTTATGNPSADDVAWDAPKAWQSVPNANTMRKATYKIPKAGGDPEDAELTVTAASGGVEANVKRWAGQFGSAEPKTTEKTVNGLKVTIVEIKGTFASGGGMMGGATTPKEKFMLLGAVVDGGDRQHFFKMTGPEKTVTAARKDFDALVTSLHPGK
jgi:hypothetical protein